MVDLRVTLARGEPPPPPPLRPSCNGTPSDSNNHESIRRQNAISTWKAGCLRPWEPRYALATTNLAGICDRISYVLRSLLPTRATPDVKEADWLERASETSTKSLSLSSLLASSRGCEKGERRRGKKGKKEVERDTVRQDFSPFDGEETARRKNRGDCTEQRRESCKLENFPRPYYLRRDHRPAPRGLSGIPRSLNTPPTISLPPPPSQYIRLLSGAVFIEPLRGGEGGENQCEKESRLETTG